ncbi:MAG: DNA polymerase III subunit gamma/tau [Ignavibacteria bacterium]|nr:DNA polymerase III subunit gamma/tau [Ignavibacteria bacterium]
MSEQIYQVTARKWRPQIYDDVIGQEHVTQTLKNSIKAGKVAHAFIFAGPRGIGKTSTARILAKSLNCPNQKNFNPCNVCETCKTITSGANIDVIEIDGASNRRIDEIRTLRESVKYAPSTVKYKIYIIDEVHMLTNESFNALLKTLEEPPAHVIFIFATTDIHKVPSTILSRCQRYDFRRLTMDEIKTHLANIAKAENVEFEDDALSIIAKKADGAMRDAQSIFDQIVAYSGGKVTFDEVSNILNAINEDIYFRISDAVISKNHLDAFKVSNEVYYNGWDLITFVNGLIEHFRNILSVNITNDTSLVEASETAKEKYKSFSSQFSNNDILRILSLLTKCQTDLKQSSNQKLTLEIALAQLVELPSAVDIESLIKEIKSLKGKSVSRTISSNLTTKIAHPIDKTISETAKTSSNQKEPALELYNTLEKSEKPKIIADKIIPSYTSNSMEEIQQRWKSFIEIVKNDRSLIGSSLEKSTLHSIEKNQINLICNQPEQITVIESFKDYLSQESKKYFGAPIRFSVKKEPSKTPVKQTSEQQNTPSSSVSNSDQNEIYDFIINELSGEKISD